MFKPLPVAIVWLILPLQAVFAEDSAWRHSGLVCWYDAAVGVSVDERGAVREWKDRSGNGHDALTAAGDRCWPPTKSIPGRRSSSARRPARAG